MNIIRKIKEFFFGRKVNCEVEYYDKTEFKDTFDPHTDLNKMTQVFECSQGPEPIHYADAEEMNKLFSEAQK